MNSHRHIILFFTSLVGLSLPHAQATVLVDGSSVNGSFSITENLNVTGNSTVGGVLGVTGDSTIGGSLDVSGSVFNLGALTGSPSNPAISMTTSGDSSYATVDLRFGSTHGGQLLWTSTDGNPFMAIDDAGDGTGIFSMIGWINVDGFMMCNSSQVLTQANLSDFLPNTLKINNKIGIGLGGSTPAYPLVVKSGGYGFEFDAANQTLGTSASNTQLVLQAGGAASTQSASIFLGGSGRGDGARNAFIVRGDGADRLFLNQYGDLLTSGNKIAFGRVDSTPGAVFLNYTDGPHGTLMQTMGRWGATWGWRMESPTGPRLQMYLHYTNDLYLYDTTGSTDVPKVRLNPTGPSSFTGGNVGIGTSTPYAKLTVNGNNAGGLGGTAFLTNQSTPTVGSTTRLGFDLAFFDDNSSTAAIDGYLANTNGITDLVFNAYDGSGNLSHFERMRILGANGNVGIGTATPEDKLHVNGDIKVDGVIRTSGPAGDIEMFEP